MSELNLTELRLPNIGDMSSEEHLSLQKLDSVAEKADITILKDTKLAVGEVLTADKTAAFAASLNAGTLLVKSIVDGQVKTINVKGKIAIPTETALSHFEVRDQRVVPTEDYSAADPDRVNIYAHKGPNEPPAGGNGGGIGLL